MPKTDIIGHYRDGRPIWAIAGGDGTEPPADTPGDLPVPPPDTAVIAKERDDARRELGSLRREIERLQKAEKERADAEKSELERLQDQLKERDTLVAAARERMRQKALAATAVLEATRLGYRRADKAIRELDAGAVEYGDDDEPLNVRALLEAALKDDPELKAAPGLPSAGGGERGRASSLTLDQLRGKSYDEINELWDKGDVQAALGRAGR